MSKISIWHRFIHPLTAFFRKKRGLFIQSKFPNIREYKICDLGGSRHFWEKLDLNIPLDNITIYNISEGETQNVNESPQQNNIKVILYDGKKIPVDDDKYDLLVCNSVLEHVPPSDRADLVLEMHRVAKCFFCQTPAQSFFLEPHFVTPFIHWLPRKLGYILAHVSLWRLISRPDTETIYNYWYGTKLLRKSDMVSLFPGTEIYCEKLLGMTKSYYVVKCK